MFVCENWGEFGVGYELLLLIVEGSDFVYEFNMELDKVVVVVLLFKKFVLFVRVEVRCV